MRYTGVSISMNKNNELEFFEEMKQKGLVPEHNLSINADGEIHRFKVCGDKNNTKNGWYRIFNNNCSAGVFGSWKHNSKFYWNKQNYKKSNKAEQKKLKNKYEDDFKNSKFRRNKIQSDAAIESNKLWNQATQPSKNSHPYLVNKDIRPYGIRQLKNKLLIPISDNKNKLISLQFINPNGSKYFKTGGKVQGGFLLLGKPEGIIFICEGYATGATIHEITKKSVIVTFTAGNLQNVIKSFKTEKWCGTKLVIFADNDEKNKINTGLNKAKECATLFGLSIIYPAFTNDEQGSDFNDFAIHVGFDKAARYLESAMKELI